MPKEKVALDVAHADYKRLCEARRLVTEPDPSWPEAEVTTYNYVRDVICQAICQGSLTINDQGDPVLKPDGAGPGVPETITLKKATGTTLLNMDGKSGTARQFAAFADMAGIGASHFGQLQMWDVELLTKLYHLFFLQRS